jgi:AraC family transcriptional regulator
MLLKTEANPPKIYRPHRAIPTTGTLRLNLPYLRLTVGTAPAPHMDSLGNIIRQRQIDPFGIIEKSYSAHCTLALHEHQSAYVSFLLAGAYIEVCRQEERVCSAGTVIWHPRTEAHADRFHSTGGYLLDLEIDSAWLDDARDLQPIVFARTFSGGLPYSLGLRMYSALADHSRSVEDVATELLAYFFTGPGERTAPAWFNRALQACSDTDQRPSLTGLANSVGVHPVHLARSFHRFLGCTFGDHLAKLRIQKAFDLLRYSKEPIAQIAYASGFADQAHLCRTFKKLTGLTPSVFRSTFQPGPQQPGEHVCKANPVQENHLPARL